LNVGANEYADLNIEPFSAYASDEFEADFAVDSGIACFMDASVAEAIESEFEEHHQDNFLNQINRQFRRRPERADIRIEGVEGNIIAFPTAKGDGVYPTFIRHDGDGNATGLITDLTPNYMLAHEDEEEDE
jgi:hypothetical protein